MLRPTRCIWLVPFRLFTCRNCVICLLLTRMASTTTESKPRASMGNVKLLLDGKIAFAGAPRVMKAKTDGVAAGGF